MHEVRGERVSGLWLGSGFWLCSGVVHRARTSTTKCTCAVDACTAAARPAPPRRPRAPPPPPPALDPGRLSLPCLSPGVTIAATGSKDRVVRLWGLAPLMPSPVHKPQIATLRVRQSSLLRRGSEGGGGGGWRQGMR